MIPDALIAFLHVRLVTRRTHSKAESLWTSIRLAKRELTRLEGQPFNTHRIERKRVYIAGLEWERRREQDSMLELGRILVEMAPEIDAVTTLTQRLELLNCNVADRADLDDAHHGMLHLMGAYCVEDSAEHRRDESNDRPLHAALSARMQQVMFDTPEGRAASDELLAGLFAPGGLFEGVPTATLQPDGTLVRNPPKLVVHEGGAA